MPGAFFEHLRICSKKPTFWQVSSSLKKIYITIQIQTKHFGDQLGQEKKNTFRITFELKDYNIWLWRC